MHGETRPLGDGTDFLKQIFVAAGARLDVDYDVGRTICPIASRLRRWPHVPARGSRCAAS